MKPLHTLFALILLPVLISTNIKHEYYVSVTKVEHSKKDESLQIISQIFIDDFEKLLRERYDETITLDSEGEKKMVNEYMGRYLSDKLRIKVNGESVNFKFIGKEYKDDIVYCYLEVKGIPDVNSVQVENRVLFDVFQDQQNIVRLKLKNKNKSFLLTPSKDKCLLNFD